MSNMKLSLTDLQRKKGEITDRLIKGEEIVLTRKNEDFAKIVPIKKKINERNRAGAD